MEGASSGARGTCVGIFNITAMRMAIVPNLPLLVGRGGMHRPTATALLALVRGWLLPVAAAIAIVAPATSAYTVALAVVVTTLLLLGDIVDVVGWWLLLSDGHAGLLEPANCAWMVNMLLAWLLTISCVAAYAAPKFARDSLYNVMEPPSSSMATMP